MLLEQLVITLTHFITFCNCTMIFKDLSSLLRSSQVFIVNFKKRPAKRWRSIQLGLMPLNQTSFAIPQTVKKASQPYGTVLTQGA